MSDLENDKAIDAVSPSRRSFVRKAIGAGFMAPVVGTFTMSGLMMSPQVANAARSGDLGNSTYTANPD
jgi:hypothetical protein